MNQLREWKDYYSREPFGFPAADYHQAMQTMATYRAAGAKRVKLEDFMRPKREELDENETPEDRLIRQVQGAFARNIRDAKLKAVLPATT